MDKKWKSSFFKGLLMEKALTPGELRGLIALKLNKALLRNALKGSRSSVLSNPEENQDHGLLGGGKGKPEVTCDLHTC